MMQPMRLAKYLSHCGVCSRRQASRLIDAAEVRVNGHPANHIDHVTDADHITVSGTPITGPAPKQLYLYHKPVGIDCKLRADDPSSLIHHLPPGARVYPIGRLDKDSRGLLLLTNDGELCNRLIHPDHHQEKEYRVVVNRPFDPHFCARMSAGVPVDGVMTQACRVEPLTEDTFTIVLKQGMNRQIRKMARHCGYRVIDLYRTRIANLVLDAEALPAGQYQPIPFTQLVLEENKK
ncbi:23S rRNA pseudouridine synthase F [Pseudoalteromonas rubra]|uniref:Pseudouridine synthase n=2 Tax=Pseudoalteromonas rubra TaxID=43658 RepID=A0A5S3WNV6_9GAMM|nr:RNA pseudouridine synthase [Pseudoalteromonas rubra]TMP28721.1 23S rRNA pseudouridine synthase F [Pseudoalteromonas rubra]TMP28783.1 23S rRNA pseudouridine synthase F [Pseudoalteromonas rubra]